MKNKGIQDTTLLAVDYLLWDEMPSDSETVEIMTGDFEQTASKINGETFVYLDPPYKPLSETSSFTSYTKGGFNDAEQVRLRDFCTRISRQKTQFIASNSDPIESAGISFFEQIYRQFKIKRVFATRLINADPEKRGLVSEIMISNV